MTLSQLKDVYINKGNINAVNQITEIENIQHRTELPYNKIINYLLSICTSKNNKKILNLLEFYYPLKTTLSSDDVIKITNKNYIAHNSHLDTNINTKINNNHEINENNTIIKFVKYKDISDEIKETIATPTNIEEKQVNEIKETIATPTNIKEKQVNEIKETITTPTNIKEKQVNEIKETITTPINIEENNVEPKKQIEKPVKSEKTKTNKNQKKELKNNTTEIK